MLHKTHSLDTPYVQQAFLEAALRSNSLQHLQTSRDRIASLAGYVWPETDELRAGMNRIEIKNPLCPLWSRDV
jgi:hypothetical protein